MTPIEKVYSAFLSKISDSELAIFTKEELYQDLRQLLDEALAQFKFPKVSLTIIGDNFEGNLDNREVQLLATYMRCGWLNRCILSGETLRPMYDEKDFSPANLIDKLNTLLDSEISLANDLETTYYRVDNNKPFDYTQLATLIE